jgi:hypothetical protein
MTLRIIQTKNVYIYYDSSSGFNSILSSVPKTILFLICVQFSVPTDRDKYFAVKTYRNFERQNLIETGIFLWLGTCTHALNG